MNLLQFKTMSRVDLFEVRCSTYATLFMFCGVIILSIAFVTPLWLECEKIPEQRFQRLGLWEVCFARLQDHNFRYDRILSGCRWIFDEDYAFLMDFLEPSKYKFIK